MLLNITEKQKKYLLATAEYDISLYNEMIEDDLQEELNVFLEVRDIDSIDVIKTFAEELKKSIQESKNDYKYYVEFVTNDDEPYSMQSKYFCEKKDALEWFKNSFDFISDSVSVFLMAQCLDSGDIEQIKKIK